MKNLLFLFITTAFIGLNPPTFAMDNGEGGGEGAAAAAGGPTHRPPVSQEAAEETPLSPSWGESYLRARDSEAIASLEKLYSSNPGSQKPEAFTEILKGYTMAYRMTERFFRERLDLLPLSPGIWEGLLAYNLGIDLLRNPEENIERAQAFLRHSFSKDRDPSTSLALGLISFYGCGLAPQPLEAYKYFDEADHGNLLGWRDLFLVDDEGNVTGQKSNEGFIFTIKTKLENLKMDDQSKDKLRSVKAMLERLKSLEKKEDSEGAGGDSK